jgi:hypothetical protein
MLINSWFNNPAYWEADPDGKTGEDTPQLYQRPAGNCPEQEIGFA